MKLELLQNSPCIQCSLYSVLGIFLKIIDHRLAPNTPPTLLEFLCSFGHALRQSKIQLENLPESCIWPEGQLALFGLVCLNACDSIRQSSVIRCA